MVHTADEVTILLVDDHPLVRYGVRSRLEAVRHFRVVAEAGNAAEALELAMRIRPNLMLTDIGMNGMTGLDLIAACSRQVPALRIVVLTMHDQPEIVRRAELAGAHGYVSKHAPAQALLDGIHAVAAGRCYISPDLERPRPSPPPDNAPLERLTPREKFILNGLARGMSNRQLAQELQISVRTVETHRFSLKRKLDIAGQAELVRFAVQHGQPGELQPLAVQGSAPRGTPH